MIEAVRTAKRRSRAVAQASNTKSPMPGITFLDHSGDGTDSDEARDVSSQSARPRGDENFV